MQASALLEGGFPGSGFLTRRSPDSLDRDADGVVDVEDTGVREATVLGGWCHVPGGAEESGAVLRPEAQSQVAFLPESSKQAREGTHLPAARGRRSEGPATVLAEDACISGLL